MKPNNQNLKGTESRSIVPEGPHDDSPTIHRWVATPKRLSPVGTAERRRSPTFCQPSLRDLFGGRHDPGVETPGYYHHVPPGQNPIRSQSAILDPPSSI